MHISTMLVFWSLASLVRNSVGLAVYLLFSVACFFTVHEHSSMGGNMNFVSPGFASQMNNTGSLLVILPLILLYLVCQKYFVEGIERSGIVG